LSREAGAEFSPRVARLLAGPECKPLPRDEEERLILQAQRGNVAARNRVVMSHARLAADKIHHFLKRYSVEIDTALTDDMFQAVLFGVDGEGGIARAIAKFDLSRGLRFSALLQQWIFGEIDTVYARRHQFGRARRTRSRFERIRGIAETLEVEGRTPSVDEVFAATTAAGGDFAWVTRDLVETALSDESEPHATNLANFTLDRPQPAAEGGSGRDVGGHSRNRLPHQLVDHAGPQEMLTAVDRSRLVEALECLTRREQAVIAALYLEERTPAEVAAELMITTKTVRAIAKESLVKLRAELE
jgi:RNA polymerase sigma factor (sigma-70 family)